MLSFCAFCKKAILQRDVQKEHVVKRIFFGPFLMHLARQKVQVTFFSREMTFRKEQKNALFVERAILHVVRRNIFFCPFLMHLARQKVQMTFSRKMMLRKEQKNALFVKRAILHVVKRNNFFVLFWCIWQGKKYKWRSFLERWPSERNKKNALFVERAILHVVKRNNLLSFSVISTLEYHDGLPNISLSRMSVYAFGLEEDAHSIWNWNSKLIWNVTCFICAKVEQHSSCSQKDFFLSFSDAFGKAKSTSDVLF